jgi:deoxycytidylate deaminase
MERDEYYMNIAMAVRKKANCLGRRVGAIIVKENRIISTGYNGTPEGMKTAWMADACGAETTRLMRPVSDMMFASVSTLNRTRSSRQPDSATQLKVRLCIRRCVRALIVPRLCFKPKWRRFITSTIGNIL